MNLKRQFIRERHEHLFLIEWFPGQSDVLSEMVYRMKSNKSPRAWDFYGRIFSTALEESGIKFCGIVPVPGSKPQSTHARIFADVLSRNLNIPVFDVLEKASDPNSQAGEQKRLSRIERTCRQDIRIREQITIENLRGTDNRGVLLVVDDIVTTGSTFRQAIDALNTQHRVMLLSLFSRSH